MIVRFFASLAEVPDDFGPSAVTIGKFDGVHIGHRRVLEALRTIATDEKLVSTVMTFDRHPLALLNSQLSPLPLSSNRQKRELLAATGVDATIMEPFTAEFSALEPEEFVDTVLVRALNARIVFVGSTFRFGHGGRGDVALLTELGATRDFGVRSIDEVFADDHTAVSSTLVRDLLSRGDIQGATRLLGRAPEVRAIVVHGQQRGRELGYPTANLSRDLEGFIPADGVYAARIIIDGQSMPAAVSIGNNPTFEGVPEKQVEAHVLDEDFDMYGKLVTLEFVDYVRPMVRFSDVDGLIAQMKLDEANVRVILGVPAR